MYENFWVIYFNNSFPFLAVENLIKKVAIKICEKKQSEPVCQGAIQSYGDILFNVTLDRTIQPEHVCERLAMCPHTRGRDHLKEYIKDVLKDKPKTEYATPTLKSTYTILQIADPHVDLEYQEVEFIYLKEITQNVFHREQMLSVTNLFAVVLNMAQLMILLKLLNTGELKAPVMSH